MNAQRVAWSLGLVMVLAMGPARAAADKAAADDEYEVDTSEMGKTPKELWAQFDALFLDKQWLKACARLDKLMELKEDVKKNGRKAGYAYARCAASYLKSQKLTETDKALDLSQQVAGSIPEQKPVEAALHRVLARMALEKKDLPQALAHYELASARSPEPKEEHDASLRLAKFARQAYDAGNTKAAKDAVAAALMYYPENRDAQQLKDSLEFWSETGKYLVWLLVAVIGVVAALAFRRRSAEERSHNPYDDDPYVT